MANFLYVDNSNVWIEGMRVSAVKKAQAPDIWTAMQHNILDNLWRVDFGRLYEFAGGDKKDVGRAVLFGSRPPENDSLWNAAKRDNFEVIVHDRNAANKEKKIDTDIVTQICLDAMSKMNPQSDLITLVAGDSDYVPTVEALIARGFKFDVVFWSHASSELRNACTSFVDLDPYLDHLKLID